MLIENIINMSCGSLIYIGAKRVMFKFWVIFFFFFDLRRLQIVWKGKGSRSKGVWFNEKLHFFCEIFVS